MDSDERPGYKKVKTGRGFTYSYYFSAANAGMPVLFFAHGFPSSSFSWRHQIKAFQGYGLIVPDMLGYGGTDKPVDPTAYIGSALAQDMVDILKAEKIGQVVGIAHDWGTRVLSRLIDYHPERVSACAFIGAGYGPPNSKGTDPISKSKNLADMMGYDIVAYMRFFIEKDVWELIEKNLDSFLDLLYPATPKVWKENMCVDGGARVWIKHNTRTSLPSWTTQEDRDHQKRELTAGRMSAPLCWYKVLVEDEHYEDDAKVSSERRVVQQPLLFIACTQDCITRPEFGDETHGQNINVTGNLTRREVDADHWAVESHPDAINAILREWIEGLQGAT
ncbi:alpha/beta-hydrolase [Mycena maculata]|uniref:Alpha/beta-hydrolase n=1 Tax=Mycena maculata TaxID=230809 RepID=A0AAD7HAU4_9AGAR|nr:alpha/beta-hydrolase [Mycena maculata]